MTTIKLIFFLVIVFLILLIVLMPDGVKKNHDNILDISLKNKEDITVFTQNTAAAHFIGKKKRLQELKKVINDYDFDFVFLQEMVFSSNVDTLREGYNAIYEDGRFGPRGGLVILTKAKPDKVEFHKFIEQGSFLNAQIFDRLIEKGFLVIRLGDMTYINTHLVAVYGTNKEHRNHEYQNKQLFQLISFLEDEINNGKNVILAGDFNFNHDSKKYQRLIPFLKDQTSPLNPLFEYNDKLGQVDFIFSSQGSSTNHSKVEYPTFVSDHPGISVRLSLQ